METDFLFAVHFWETLVGPIVGGISGAFTLLVGLRLLGRQVNCSPPSREAAPTSDPFVHGSTTERRISVRRTGAPVEVFISDAEAATDPVRGWVEDRSMGGLCLLVEKEVPVGTVLSIMACHAPSGTPWTKVEVKTCREADGSWELGCQFLRTPSWSVLLLFG